MRPRCIENDLPLGSYVLLLILEAFIEFPAEVGLVLAPKGVLLGSIVEIKSGDLFLRTNGGESGLIVLLCGVDVPLRWGETWPRLCS